MGTDSAERQAQEPSRRPRPRIYEAPRVYRPGRLPLRAVSAEPQVGMFGLGGMMWWLRHWTAREWWELAERPDTDLVFRGDRGDRFLIEPTGE
jgi:hypothetical protein